jgi:hypothetical protein
MRKTVSIVELIESANDYLAKSPPVCRNERIGVHDFVSNHLHRAGVYSGFGYAQPYGSPGSDDSRTFFYVHRKLKARVPTLDEAIDAEIEAAANRPAH